MRRGALYTLCKRIGANKLALGHHLDDAFLQAAVFDGVSDITLVQDRCRHAGYVLVASVENADLDEGAGPERCGGPRRRQLGEQLDAAACRVDAGADTLDHSVEVELL